MLNFFALIKKRPESSARVISFFLMVLPLLVAFAQEKQRPSSEKAEVKNASFHFYAAARVLSPDGKTELGTQELRVNLDGNKTAVLKGRSVSVTLESEPNFFRKTQMLKIVGSGGGSGALNAGMFRLNPRQPHSFLYTDKTKGWLMEVRLRPVAPHQQPSGSSKKSKSPVRIAPKKTKRLPA